MLEDPFVVCAVAAINDAEEAIASKVSIGQAEQGM